MTGSGELAPLVFDAEIVDEPVSRDPVPIDLDAVIDAEVVEYVPWPSRQCWTGGGTRLVGGPVTDPAQVEAIAARIAYARLPLWRRVFARPPAGWRS